MMHGYDDAASRRVIHKCMFVRHIMPHISHTRGAAYTSTYMCTVCMAGSHQHCARLLHDATMPLHQPLRRERFAAALLSCRVEAYEHPRPSLPSFDYIHFSTLYRGGGHSSNNETFFPFHTCYNWAITVYAIEGSAAIENSCRNRSRYVKRSTTRTITSHSRNCNHAICSASFGRTEMRVGRWRFSLIFRTTAGERLGVLGKSSR